MIEERTSNGVPSVSIEFPDGYKDALLLNKFYGNEEDRMANVQRCHYIGHLVNEPEACVAMTGCLGSEDVELTILSTHATKAHAFKWTKDNNVEILDSSSNVKIKVSILFTYLNIFSTYNQCFHLGFTVWISVVWSYLILNYCTNKKMLK